MLHNWAAFYAVSAKSQLKPAKQELSLDGPIR
jgi:hypothetical protein